MSECCVCWHLNLFATGRVRTCFCCQLRNSPLFRNFCSCVTMVCLSNRFRAPEKMSLVGINFMDASGKSASFRSFVQLTSTFSQKKWNIQSKKQTCSEEKSGRTILVQWWSSHMAEITFVLLKQTLGFVWRADALPPWSWCESATACTSPLLLMVRMCFLFTWYGVSRGG